MAINFLLKRSNTASKRPTAAQLDIGELSLNYDANTAGVFFEDSAGNVRKVGPAEVSATAPNATPAGSSGNSLGELWYDTSTSNLKVWTGAAFANAMSTAAAAGNNTEIQFNNSGVLGASSALTWSGSLLTATLLKSSQSSGDEGGQLDLAAPATNTTITTGVSIDVWQNRLRIFETGGTNRGASMDITAQATGVGSTIATSANKLSIFAATTSAELAGVISDETGTGSLVFGTSPAITTSLTTGSTSFDLLNTTATTVNFAGAAATMTIGASGGNAYFPTAITIGSNNNLISGTQLQVNASSGFAQIAAVGDGQNGIVSARSYSAAGLAIFQNIRTRGSYASPTTIIDGDGLGEWRTLGYDGTTFRAMTRVIGVADGTVSGTSTPSRIEFYTTTSGTTSSTLKLTLKNTGQLLLNTSGGDNAMLEIANTSNTLGTAARIINASSIFGAGVTTATGVRTAMGTTVGSAVTDLYHFATGQGTFNVAPTTQAGYLASGLTGASGNNYGFLSNQTAAANVWNFYAIGTAQSHFTGAVSMGTATTVTSGHQLQVNSNSGFAAATVAGDGVQAYSSIRAYGTGTNPTLQTLRARGTLASPTIVADGDTIGEWVPTAYTGSTFYAPARMVFEMDGTVSGTSMPSRFVLETTPTGTLTRQERLRVTDTGQLLLGATAAADSVGIRLARNITGGTVSYQVYADPTVQSDVTNVALNVTSVMNTAAAAFTLSGFRHYTATQGTVGAGSTVSNQYGYFTDPLTSATINYSFFADNSETITAGKTYFGYYSNSNIATGGGTAWNFYAPGTAPNFFAGAVTIGNPTSYAYRSGVTPYVQINGDVSNLGLGRWSNNTSAPLLEFFKSRSGTVGTQTIVQVGDSLGTIRFNGSDGTAGRLAAEIFCLAESTPTANTDVPGSLVFATTPDGSTSTTARMYISASGRVGIGSFSTGVNNPLSIFDVYDTSTSDLQIANFRSAPAAVGTSWTYVNIRKENSASAYYGGAVGGYLAQGIGAGLALFTYGGTTTPSEGARLTSAGFFGVGTGNPFTTLHAYKAITGGSPAASGTTDANVITRIQGGSVGFDIGGTAPGAQWIQPRLISDLSSNFGLYLCPNGGGATVGTVNSIVVGVTGGSAVRDFLVAGSSTSTTVGLGPGLVVSNTNTTTNNSSTISFTTITGADTSHYTSAVIGCIHGARTNSQTATGTLTFSTVSATNTAAAERMRLTAVGNLKIGGTADRATTEGTNQLVLFNGTAPVGTLTNGASFYVTAGEMRVMDAAGNATLLSPHDPTTNEWIYDSTDTRTGKRLRIRMEALMKFLNDHFGLDMVEEFIEAV